MNLRLKIPQDYKSSGSKMRTGDLKTTYYVLDAQGNAMSNYSFTTRPTDAKANKLVLQERNIYGSKRVGIEQLQLVVAEPAYVTPDSRWEDVWELPAYTPISMRDYHWSWYKNRPSVPVSTYKQEIGDKRYELANHLGNVLNVVTDRKLPVDIPLTANSPQGDGIVDYFTADVVSYSDYLPFGMTMPGRSGNSDAYNRGYQGSLKDNEIAGNDNHYTTFFRELDPRLGRWWSIDPVFKPKQSPYCSMSNNPLIMIDPRGDDDYYNYKGQYLGRDETKTNEIRLVSQEQWDKSLETNRKDTNPFNDSKPKVTVPTSRVIKFETAEAQEKMFNQLETKTEKDGLESAGLIVLDVTNAKVYIIDDTKNRIRYKDHISGEEFQYDNGDPSVHYYNDNKFDKVIIGGIHTHPQDENDKTHGPSTKESHAVDGAIDTDKSSITKTNQYVLDLNLYKAKPDESTEQMDRSTNVGRDALKTYGTTH